MMVEIIVLIELAWRCRSFRAMRSLNNSLQHKVRVVSITEEDLIDPILQIFWTG